MNQKDEAQGSKVNVIVFLPQAGSRSAAVYQQAKELAGERHCIQDSAEFQHLVAADDPVIVIQYLREEFQLEYDVHYVLQQSTHESALGRGCTS